MSTVTSLTPSTTTSTPPPTPPTPLSLNCYCVVDQQELISIYESREQWKNAEWYFFSTAYVVSSIAAIALTVYIAPLYLPITIFAAKQVLPTYYSNILKPRNDDAKLLHETVEREKCIQQKTHELRQISNTDLRTKLTTIGIDPRRIQHITRLSEISPDSPLRALIPLIARFDVWKGQADSARERAQEKRDQAAQKLEEIQTLTDYQKIRKKREEADHLLFKAYKIMEESHLSSKVKAAFALRFIGDVCSGARIEEYGEITPLNYHTRQIRAADGEETPYFQKFTLTADDTVTVAQSFSRDWIARSRIEQISKHVFANQATFCV